MNPYVYYLFIMLLYSCCYLPVVDSGIVNIESYGSNAYGFHLTAISKSGLIRLCHHLTANRVCTKFKRSAWYNTTLVNDFYYELDIFDNATKPNYDIKLHHEDAQATNLYIETGSNCERSGIWRGGSKECYSTTYPNYDLYKTEAGRDGYVAIKITNSKPFYCKKTK